MTVGIIGYGVMGAAVAQGLATSGSKIGVTVYDTSDARRREAQARSITVAPDPEALVRASEVLVVAVKPQDLDELLAAVGKRMGKRRLVSIVAGRSIATFEAACRTREIARLMPNIAATVHEAFVGVSCHTSASHELRDSALAIARSMGMAVEVPERLLAAVTGVAGSGIAYALAFLHALAMGGVHAGMDYPSSLKAAAQTVRGAAALLGIGGPSQTGPIDLLTRVTSPAGTTIEGIKALEERGFTAAVMEAVKAAADRAAALEG